MKRHVISLPPVLGSSRRAVLVSMSALAVVLSVLLVASWELPGVPDSSVQCRAGAAGPDGNGEAVIRAGAALDVAADGIVIGLAVAMQETGLRNLANASVPETLDLPHDGLAADHHAVGILALNEQWGAAVELMSPDVAARKWFTAMRGIAGWQAMPPQQVASAVMHSALPDTYAGRLDEARRFYERHREASAAMCDAQARW
jgi:hypothetical protein